MPLYQQSKHEKWAEWTTEEIRRYLKKYGTASIAPGRCSTHRRKKVSFLKKLLHQREQAEALILNNLIPF